MTRRLVLFFALMIGFSTVTIAQSKDQKDVAAAVEVMRKAMVDADSAALDRISADSLSYGHSGGSVQTKAVFIHSIASKHSDFVSIELTKQSIQIFDKTAIVRHTLFAETADEGKAPGTVKLAVILVWQKQHGEWKLLARQAVHLDEKK